MNDTASQPRKVLEVWRRSGCPMLRCREALSASDWDVDKAMIWLRDWVRRAYPNGECRILRAGHGSQ